MPVDRGTQPFNEQVEFFRQKTNLGTEAWTDLWQQEHDRAFVVAGAMKKDLVADLRNAVDSAIAEGTTLEQFRKDFDKTVAKHGWQYKGGRGWRTRVIYETNLRTSYAAGRRAQREETKQDRPYWRYRHSAASENPRDEHLSWDGLTLSADDAWWDTHDPPNGWGCKCYVETLRREDVPDGPDEAPEVRTRTVTVGENGPSPRTVEVPEGIDPGFAYPPGKSWVEGNTPPPLDDLLPSASTAAAGAGALPAARSASAERVLPNDLDDQDYVARFLAEFGLDNERGDRSEIIEDVTGEPLLISDALFRERGGELKVRKRGRERYVLLLADAIREPDEIWEAWATFGARRVLRRRYVARWQVEGSEVPALAVFETGPQGWAGVTAHKPDDVSDLDSRSRIGERVYRRGEE